MTDGSPAQGTTGTLRFGPAHFIAATFAVVVGGIHLVLGAINWGRYATLGLYIPPDLRWPLFVVSGAAMLLGIAAVAVGIAPRVLYALGIGLQLVYIGGYFGWHLSGHRPLILVGAATHHDAPLIEELLAHAFSASWYATVALVSELGLIVVLGYLLSTDRG